MKIEFSFTTGVKLEKTNVLFLYLHKKRECHSIEFKGVTFLRKKGFYLFFEMYEIVRGLLHRRNRRR